MEDSRNEEILKNVRMKEEVAFTNKEMDKLQTVDIVNLHDKITKLED